MQIWIQNLLVAAAVLCCCGFLARQGWRTLAGKRSKLGSCCSTGCGAHEAKKPGSGERIVFLPAEMLGRKK
ncbi:MAG TPA: hypothetical protein VGG44_02315 [Tepidisphaeraceae bacterium]|jgi:hypothetical protein